MQARGERTCNSSRGRPSSKEEAEGQTGRRVPGEVSHEGDRRLRLSLRLLRGAPEWRIRLRPQPGGPPRPRRRWAPGSDRRACRDCCSSLPRRRLRTPPTGRRPTARASAPRAAAPQSRRRSGAPAAPPPRAPAPSRCPFGSARRAPGWTPGRTQPPAPDPSPCPQAPLDARDRGSQILLFLSGCLLPPMLPARVHRALSGSAPPDRASALSRRLHRRPRTGAPRSRRNRFQTRSTERPETIGLHRGGGCPHGCRHQRQRPERCRPALRRASTKAPRPASRRPARRLPPRKRGAGAKWREGRWVRRSAANRGSRPGSPQSRRRAGRRREAKDASVTGRMDGGTQAVRASAAAQSRSDLRN